MEHVSNIKCLLGSKNLCNTNNKNTKQLYTTQKSMEFYLSRKANSLEPWSTVNDFRYHCTKHDSKQRHLMTVIDAIPTEWGGKPVGQHRGLMLIRRNNCNGTIDHERSKSRTSICTHAHASVLLYSQPYTPRQAARNAGNRKCHVCWYQTVQHCWFYKLLFLQVQHELSAVGIM